MELVSYAGKLRDLPIDMCRHTSNPPLDVLTSSVFEISQFYFRRDILLFRSQVLLYVEKMGRSVSISGIGQWLLHPDIYYPGARRSRSGPTQGAKLTVNCTKLLAVAKNPP